MVRNQLPAQWLFLVSDLTKDYRDIEEYHRYIVIFYCRTYKHAFVKCEHINLEKFAKLFLNHASPSQAVAIFGPPRSCIVSSLTVNPSLSPLLSSPFSPSSSVTRHSSLFSIHSLSSHVLSCPSFAFLSPCQLSQKSAYFRTSRDELGSFLDVNAPKGNSDGNLASRMIYLNDCRLLQLTFIQYNDIYLTLGHMSEC